MKTTECTRKRRGRPPTHGMSKSPEYKSWRSILDRLYNPNTPSYKLYGSKLHIAAAWDPACGGSFENFLLDMGYRPKGTTIDRINNKFGYFPWNCRWATHKEQQRNRTDNRMLSYEGKTLCLSAWAELLEIPRSTIESRIRYGWSTEEILQDYHG